MCYPDWDSAYKRTFAAIGKSSLCGGSRFPLSPSGPLLCLTAYNHNVWSTLLNKISPISFVPTNWRGGGFLDEFSVCVMKCLNLF